MANTTFGNLKINALRRAGNNYNANDATKLELAGNIINGIMGKIQKWIKGSPWTLDLDNTVNTTADQAYVDLSDTDILEILQVSQRVTTTKLRQLTRLDYVEAVPDPTKFGGVPEVGWFPKVNVNGSGANIWSIYLVPTPSSVQAMYYDYVKDLKFSADGTGANAEFSKLPPFADEWIYTEFEPLFYRIIDKNNRRLIEGAEATAEKQRPDYISALSRPKDLVMQAGSARDAYPWIYKPVKTTPTP